jgi:hypothetical protein
LQNPWKTRFLQVSARERQKIPFVFNGHKFGFPNFQKLFLGRNGESQCVAGEKIWIRVFSIWRARGAATGSRLEVCPEISLAYLRIFRNKLSRPQQQIVAAGGQEAKAAKVA